MSLIHQKTDGMHVAMGHTCACGEWFKSWNEWLGHLEEKNHEPDSD